MTQGRIIVIDASVIAHKCIFDWERQTILKSEGKSDANFIMEPDYTYFKVMISLLKKVVVQRGDKVIIALDARNSWRRAFYPIYKGQRHAGRQAHKTIDWGHHYNRLDRMNAILNKATDWHFVKISSFATFFDLVKTDEGQKFKIDDGRYMETDDFGIEADDIMACCAKYYSDREVILVSIDADLDQLCFYPLTKMFSPNLKLGVSKTSPKGCYKIVSSPLDILADKVRKGDVSDNILVTDDDTEEQAEIRRFIINLIELPSFVEKPIIKVLDELKPKTIHYDDLPFKNSLGKPENYNKIYLLDSQVTYEDAIKAHEKRLVKEEEKKIETREKAKQKRLLRKVEGLR